MTNAPTDVNNFLVNCEYVTLQLSGTVYILMQEVDLHIGRAEHAEPTSAGTRVYLYESGDNWFQFTALLSNLEFVSFNTKTQRTANGAMTSQAFTLVFTDVSGSTKTVAATGNFFDIFARRAPVGMVKMTCKCRITGDTVTIS